MRRRAAWVGYDEMAATGVYGALLNETGELSLPPDGENEAAFFCSTLAGRDRVLDLGCGPGFPSVVLASSARTVCGIDAAPAMLGKAKEALARLGISNVRLIRAFADKLPFVACAFDGIAVCGTLGSLGNPGAVLRELARVAAPGALVASLEQDFRRRLSEGVPREERRVRRDRGRLELQVVRYLTDPYRIRYEYYVLDPASRSVQRLLECAASRSVETAPTEVSPSDLPREAVVDAFCEEEVQYDPELLRVALERAGFELVKQTTAISYGVPHIFSVFRRQS